jgi:hypothetical protein
MSAFLALDKQIPRLEDIVEKPSTIHMPEDSAALLMIMFQATDALKSQDELTKFMTFINRIESSESQAVFFTMMVRSKNGAKLARSNLQIADWAVANHELF